MLSNVSRLLWICQCRFGANGPVNLWKPTEGARHTARRRSECRMPCKTRGSARVPCAHARSAEHVLELLLCVVVLHPLGEAAHAARGRLAAAGAQGLSEVLGPLELGRHHLREGRIGHHLAHLLHGLRVLHGLHRLGEHGRVLHGARERCHAQLRRLGAVGQGGAALGCPQLVHHLLQGRGDALHLCLERRVLHHLARLPHGLRVVEHLHDVAHSRVRVVRELVQAREAQARVGLAGLHAPTAGVGRYAALRAGEAPGHLRVARAQEEHARRGAEKGRHHFADVTGRP
mmetsp:Transcript_14884/g.50180  ORF Transcript_14884/g.50180 Transcript_14884/m.50180 type:complete len:288 (+) Transcript_14884:117-980(+)